MLNNKLLRAAIKQIPHKYLLTNVLSRRVRAIEYGSEPIIKRSDGDTDIDIALKEISSGKLEFDSGND